jgi:hypothetical protein
MTMQRHRQHKKQSEDKKAKNTTPKTKNMSNTEPMKNMSRNMKMEERIGFLF